MLRGGLEQRPPSSSGRTAPRRPPARGRRRWRSSCRLGERVAERVDGDLPDGAAGKDAGRGRSRGGVDRASLDGASHGPRWPILASAPERPLSSARRGSARRLRLPGRAAGPAPRPPGTRRKPPSAKNTIRVRMAGRLEPVAASTTPKTNEPMAPPKRSNTPKKPNISPDLCRGIKVANSERDERLGARPAPCPRGRPARRTAPWCA